MPLTPFRTRLKAVQDLCRYFGQQRHPKWDVRGVFHDSQTCLIQGVKFTVVYSVNVVPHGGGTEGVFRSMVTFSPNQEPRPAWQGGWVPSLREGGWYKSETRRLRQQGYRGQWLATEWGRVGYFSKRHPDGVALIGEVAALQAMAREHRALPKRRRTMR